MKTKKLFLLLFFIAATTYILISYGSSINNYQSNKDKEKTNSEVSKGFGALGLKINNYTGSAYTIRVCDRSGHKCGSACPAVYAQNNSNQSAQLIVKIRYLDNQGNYGSWNTCGSTMVNNGLTDDYKYVYSGPTVLGGPNYINGTNNSCAQIMYVLTRGSQSKSLMFQINKVFRGIKGPNIYKGYYSRYSWFASNYVIEVGPGFLCCCDYRTDASASASNCTLIWQDWITTADNDARRKICFRTKSWNQTGTIFWTISTYEYLP